MCVATLVVSRHCSMAIIRICTDYQPQKVYKFLNTFSHLLTLAMVTVDTVIETELKYLLFSIGPFNSNPRLKHRRSLNFQLIIYKQGIIVKTPRRESSRYFQIDRNDFFCFGDVLYRFNYKWYCCVESSLELFRPLSQAKWVLASLILYCLIFFYRWNKLL